jgi:hypothetical protein
MDLLRDRPKWFFFCNRQGALAKRAEISRTQK